MVLRPQLVQGYFEGIIVPAMASELRLATTQTPDAAVHWLPCSIAHTGQAPVSSYFLPKQAGEALLPHATLPITRTSSYRSGILVACTIKCRRYCRDLR